MSGLDHTIARALSGYGDDVTYCDAHCPFLGCASCPYAGGENPSVATESARVSAGQGCRMGSSAPSASDPRDAANVRGRGPTSEESSKMDRTRKASPAAGA